MSRAAKGADCKSAGYAFAGSSPASPTTSVQARSMCRLCGPSSAPHSIVVGCWFSAGAASILPRLQDRTGDPALDSGGQSTSILIESIAVSAAPSPSR